MSGLLGWTAFGGLMVPRSAVPANVQKASFIGLSAFRLGDVPLSAVAAWVDYAAWAEAPEDSLAVTAMSDLSILDGRRWRVSDDARSLLVDDAP